VSSLLSRPKKKKKKKKAHFTLSIQIETLAGSAQPPGSLSFFPFLFLFLSFSLSRAGQCHATERRCSSCSPSRRPPAPPVSPTSFFSSSLRRPRPLLGLFTARSAGLSLPLPLPLPSPSTKPPSSGVTIPRTRDSRFVSLGNFRGRKKIPNIWPRLKPGLDSCRFFTF
jgi:hypothetical protein